MSATNDASALDYQGQAQLQDSRTIVESSGWVDCFICGHKVNIFKAHRIEAKIGPTAFMHGTCRDQMTPENLGKLYQTMVWGVALNASKPIRGTQIQQMHDQRTKDRRKR